MKVWLDDVRPMPSGYDIRVSSAKALMKLVDCHSSFITGLNITMVSFDHDLGDGLTGYDVAKYIEELAYDGICLPFEWKVHSSNPVGSANIKRAMLMAEKYWRLNYLRIIVDVD